jgi:hypothetical protein
VGVGGTTCGSVRRCSRGDRRRGGGRADSRGDVRTGGRVVSMGSGGIKWGPRAGDRGLIAVTTLTGAALASGGIVVQTEGAPAGGARVSPSEVPPSGFRRAWWLWRKCPRAGGWLPFAHHRWRRGETRGGVAKGPAKVNGGADSGVSGGQLRHGAVMWEKFHSALAAVVVLGTTEVPAIDAVNGPRASSVGCFVN